MSRLFFLDSSFWSRLADPEGSERRATTAAFLREAELHHRIIISDAVLVELAAIADAAKRSAILDRLWAARARLARPRRDAQETALELLKAGRWSARRFADLLHVAYTVIEGADALVTWDEDDLARERPRRVTHAYTRARGLLTPLIGTPKEVAAWLGLRIGT